MVFNLIRTSTMLTEPKKSITIDSIEQLMELIEEEGQVVVSNIETTAKDENGNYYLKKTPTIEIYDTWRE